ncbi:DUF3892 domain-containing protein [Pantoea stewartii]|uniref:DUF3892 domain-containing protein n=1 Tax=Pantoea stewartii TaxID=66269 RepID=UPI00345C0121
MVDFYIYAVRMDQAGQHIESVQVIKNGKSLNDVTVNSRQFVAELIGSGLASFKTITLVNNKWVYGADVHVINNIFITTDPNKTKIDNLSHLPRF